MRAVSNPYGPPGGGDQNPYGQQQPQYGAPQYGAPQYGAPGGPGFGSEPAQTDGMSIAAFVSGLLCCAPVSIILGFIGLKRTKNGVRKGRWAAVTGLVLGLLGLLTWVALGIMFAAGVAFFNSVVTASNAEAGQCVNIDEDSDGVLLREAECSESHDGEIIAVVEVTEDNKAQATDAVGEFCLSALSAEDEATIAARIDELQVVGLFEDPDDPRVGEDVVCYVEGDDKLTEPLL